MNYLHLTDFGIQHPVSSIEPLKDRSQSRVTSNQRPNNNYRQVFNSALRILTGRDHSRAELIRKLKQRDFAPNDIEKAVAECERLDYINDERSARVYIEQLIRKGYGRKRLDYEMKKKGFKGERIQNIIVESVSGADELEGARQILTKYVRRFEREPDLKKRRNKIYRFLYSRGFSQETIRKLVNHQERIFQNRT